MMVHTHISRSTIASSFTILLLSFFFYYYHFCFCFSQKNCTNLRHYLRKLLFTFVAIFLLFLCAAFVKVCVNVCVCVWIMLYKLCMESYSYLQPTSDFERLQKEMISGNPFIFIILNIINMIILKLI